MPLAQQSPTSPWAKELVEKPVSLPMLFLHNWTFVVCLRALFQLLALWEHTSEQLLFSHEIFMILATGLDNWQRILLIFPLNKEVGSLFSVDLNLTCLVKLQALAFAEEAQSTKKVNNRGKVTIENKLISQDQKGDEAVLRLMTFFFLFFLCFSIV